MMRPVIAFDESGNTGQHLLDVTQPVFALTAVNLSIEDADAVRAEGKLCHDQELKFSDLKRRPSNQQRILAMLQSPALSEATVRTCVYHKRYMVVTKIVDMLVEEWLKQRGVDLYQRGANIGLSNMWYHVMPVFCGEDRFATLLAAFVDMIRNKDEASFNDFYTAVWSLRRHSVREEFRRDLEMLLDTQDIARRVVAAADLSDLDPAIPAFVQLAAEWNTVLGQHFDIVHDTSKPIEHQREILELLMSEDEPSILVGYDRRKTTWPIRSSGIQLVDSRVERRVQIADLVSGATAYLMRGYVDASFQDGFWRELEETDVADWVTASIGPSTDVTPEELGTEEVGGINPVDYTTELIARQTAKRQAAMGPAEE